MSVGCARDVFFIGVCENFRTTSSVTLLNFLNMQTFKVI